MRIARLRTRKNRELVWDSAASRHQAVADLSLRSKSAHQTGRSMAAH